MSGEANKHCPICGRWLGNVVCQCRINQVRREMNEGRNMELLFAMHDKEEVNRSRLVAEVCTEACQ